MVFHASSLTCTVDGLAHLVSDDAAAEGVAAGRGTYIALCGHKVHAAAMVCAAGRPCPRCDRRVEVGGQLVLPEPRRRRGGRGSARSRLRRLLGHRLVLVPWKAAPRADGAAVPRPTGTTGASHRREHRRAVR